MQPLVSKTVSKLNEIALADYTVTAQFFVRAYIHRFTLFRISFSLCSLSTNWLGHTVQLEKTLYNVNVPSV